MELNDLIFLGACSLLSNKFSSSHTFDFDYAAAPNDKVIKDAVQKSWQIWKAVCDANS